MSGDWVIASACLDDVDEKDRNVSIEAIGFKIGHELFIRGERTEL